MRHDNQYKWWICLLLYNNADGCVRLVFIGLLLAGAAAATGAERKRSSRRAAAAAPAERSDIFSTSLEMFQTIALSRLKQHIY